MRSRFRSTTFLGALLATLILGSLGAMGYVLERLVRAELGKQAGEGNRLIAVGLAHEIYSFLDLHFAGLSLLESGDFRRDGGPDLLKRSFPAFESVLLVDGRGRAVKASSSTFETGFDLSTREYFREPFTTRRDFVSPPFISETRYAPASVLAHPFAEGVALAFISLTFMNEFLAGLPSSESKSIAVVDRRGVFVAHSREAGIAGRSELVTLESWFLERDLRSGSGLSIVRRPAGGEELLCWATVPGVSGWTVIVSEPTKNVFRAARLFRDILAALLVVYAVLTLAVTTSVLRLVREDIAKLVRFSKDIADGRLDAALDFGGFHDLAHLAANLGRMGVAIRERESLLRANERRLFDLLDFLPIPVILINRGKGIELMNRALTATLGWTREDIGKEAGWWRAVFDEEKRRAEARAFWRLYVSRLIEGRPREGPFRARFRCKDGTFRTLVGEAALIEERVIATFVDVSDAEASAERMAASLREKEVLLQEIHHRVKNNLQVIVSLLWLEAASVPESRQLFAESIDRIQVMSGIHELLYRSNDLSHIDLREYFENIVNWLVSTYAVGSVRPRVELKIDRIEFEIDKAIPCGLILNEVITNSLKYAFAEGAVDPVIGIRTTLAGEGAMLLELYDNGRGLPRGFEPERCDSLGLKLVLSLCSQMRATWKLESSGGTRWTICINRD